MSEELASTLGLKSNNAKTVAKIHLYQINSEELLEQCIEFAIVRNHSEKEFLAFNDSVVDGDANLVDSFVCPMEGRHSEVFKKENSTGTVSKLNLDISESSNQKLSLFVNLEGRYIPKREAERVAVQPVLMGAKKSSTVSTKPKKAQNRIHDEVLKAVQRQRKEKSASTIRYASLNGNRDIELKFETSIALENKHGAMVVSNGKHGWLLMVEVR